MKWRREYAPENSLAQSFEQRLRANPWRIEAGAAPNNHATLHWTAHANTTDGPRARDTC